MGGSRQGDRFEVLGATLQAAVLLAVAVYVFVEGIRRLFEPPEVSSTAMIVFGVIGLVGNLVAILVLTRGRGDNVNMRAAHLEVLNDALGSVAVLVAALVIAAVAVREGLENWRGDDCCAPGVLPPGSTQDTCTDPGCEC